MVRQNKCPKCNGCGYVADTEDQEPWTAWQELPSNSAISAFLGFVKPIRCPKCDGAGFLENKQIDAKDLHKNRPSNPGGHL